MKINKNDYILLKDNRVLKIMETTNIYSGTEQIIARYGYQLEIIFKHNIKKVITKEKNPEYFL